MSSLPIINDTVIESPSILSEAQPNRNGKINNMPGPRRETPPLKTEDVTLSFLMQSMIEDRREQREVNQAILTKLPNGNGNKLQAWAPTILAALLLGFAGIGWFPKQESSVATVKAEQSSLTSQMGIQTQRLSDEIAERQKLATWNEKLRNNLAALGIIVDPQTAEITVAAPARTRR